MPHRSAASPAGSARRPPEGASCSASATAERGQATVELALALPIVVAALLLVLQVGVVVRAQILVVHAARETARAAAVGERAPAPAGLDPARTSVAVHRSSGRVTAEVTYLVRTDIPVVGLVLPDLALRGGAAMRVE